MIAYRRTRDRMPAHDLMMKWLSTIKKVETGSITVEKMKLDEKGFQQPTGEFETLEADSVVLALGQDVDLSLLKGVAGLEMKNRVAQVGPKMITGAPFSRLAASGVRASSFRHFSKARTRKSVRVSTRAGSMGGFLARRARCESPEHRSLKLKLSRQPVHRALSRARQDAAHQLLGASKIRVSYRWRSRPRRGKPPSLAAHTMPKGREVQAASARRRYRDGNVDT